MSMGGMDGVGKARASMPKRGVARRPGAKTEAAAATGPVEDLLAIQARPATDDRPEEEPRELVEALRKALEALREAEKDAASYALAMEEHGTPGFAVLNALVKLARDTKGSESKERLAALDAMAELADLPSDMAKAVAADLKEAARKVPDTLSQGNIDAPPKRKLEGPAEAKPKALRKPLS